jgi:hypothetical protein
VKKIVALIKDWFANRKLQSLVSSFDRLIKAQDPMLISILKQEADAIARTWCMKWLDNKRVNHCSVCPNTDQLIKLGDGYLCPGHMKAFNKGS